MHLSTAVCSLGAGFQVSSRDLVVIKRSTRSLDHLIHVLAMLARHVQLGLLFGCRVVQTMMRLALGPLVVYVCEDEAMECTASTRASLLSA